MKSNNSFSKGKTGILFILPSLAGVVLFLMLPYADVIRRAFINIADGRFTGLSNFAEVIENEAFRIAMRNTFAFAGICIPLLLLGSLLIAMFFYENPRTSLVLKTGFLIPMAIPVASVVLMWKLLFDGNGIINGMLNDMGLDTINWMDSNAAFWILVGSYIWKNLGYNVILWLAALSTINPSLKEAAMMDGASGIQRFRYVTMPALRPAAFVISVLALLNSFKVFREAYLVAGDYPDESIYLIQHLFNNWFRNIEIDKMAAGSVINSVILIILILFLQRIWDKRGDQ